MSESGNSPLHEVFLENPNAIYDAPDKLSREDRRELFELEESLVTMLYVQNVRSGENPSVVSEQELACKIEEFE